MHYSKLILGDTFCAEDLPGPVVLTISRVTFNQIEGKEGKQHKWVVRFAEMDARHQKDPRHPPTGLVMNKTKARAIKNLYGPETDEWVGKPIEIFPGTVNAFGDPRKPCICVRAPAARAQKKEVATK